MASTCVADTGFWIVEHVSLVDIELLLCIELASVLLSLDELVVHSVGGIVNDAHLHIGKRIPARSEIVCSLYKPAVVVLVGIRVVVLVLAAICQILALHFLIGYICKVAPVVAAEHLCAESTHYVPRGVMI